MSSRHTAPTRRDRAGFTLVEVMLAMAATAIVATSIASLLFVTSHAGSGSDSTRSMAVQTLVATERLGAETRSAQMVLDSGPEYLVFWTGDWDGDGQPSLSELCRIERDIDSDELRAYRAPADLSDAQDRTYDLGEDFEAVTAALRGRSIFPVEVWARGVTAMELHLDNGDPRLARGMNARLTMRSEDQEHSVIVSAALRGVR